MPETVTPINLITPEMADKLLEGSANVEIKPTGELTKDGGTVPFHEIGLYVEGKIVAGSWTYSGCADEFLRIMNDL